MRFPAWLDVALEGGVLELERALAEYRSLRRGVTGDWRARATRLAELSACAKSRLSKVEAAIERAHRRAKTDGAAQPAEALAQRVEHERAELHEALSELRGKKSALPAQLGWLHELASEESHYARSLIRFRRERAGLTVVLFGLGLAAPWSSWVAASMGGQVHTVLSVEGLEQPAVWVLLLALLGLVAASWARLLDWGWLGVRPPPLLGPSSLAAAVGVNATAAVTSFACLNPMPVLVTLVASAGLGAVLVLSALWRDIFARGADVSEMHSALVPALADAETRNGAELAQGPVRHASPLPLELRHPRL